MAACTPQLAIATPHFPMKHRTAMAQHFGRMGIRPELVRDIIKGLREIERTVPRTYDPAPKIRRRQGEQR